MTAWWYADKGNNKTGPVETDDIKRLLQTGKIDHTTMLWHEGMGSWRPLGQDRRTNRAKGRGAATVATKGKCRSSEFSISYSLAAILGSYF